MSEDDFFDTEGSWNASPEPDSKTHARAQHNELERKRRDKIKDMYSELKDAIPETQTEPAGVPPLHPSTSAGQSPPNASSEEADESNLGGSQKSKKKASRAVILQRAVDLITAKQKALDNITQENKKLERENAALAEELAVLENTLNAGNADSGGASLTLDSQEDSSEDVLLVSSPAVPQQQPSLINRKRPVPRDDYYPTVQLD